MKTKPPTTTLPGPTFPGPTLPRPDPATQALLDAMAEANLPPMHAGGVDAARSAMRDARTNDIDPPEVGAIIDASIPGPGGDIAVRRYYPGNTSATRLATLVYFHGGGFVIGDLDTHDNICRYLCAAAGVLVISVDYRLAPEHPYPAAPLDAIAALEWVFAQGATVGADPGQIAVGGDSAGGTLAAVCAQHARDHEIPLAAQLLFYPVVDLSGHWPSYDEHAGTPPITRPVLDWFWRAYLGEDNVENSDLRAECMASPINTPSVAALAPAFVLTAGLDPLRDEGRAYAERLIAEGVETVYFSAMGTIHGFLRMGRLIPATRDALDAAAGFLRARSTGSTP